MNSYSSYLEFIRNWFLLLAFPLGLIILYFRQLALHRKLQQVTIDKADEGNLFIFTSDNQKDKIALPITDILFIESEDNYVRVAYR